MTDLDKDTRSVEEIKAGWAKNGLVFGKVLSPEEFRKAKNQIAKVNTKIHCKENKAFERELRKRDKPTILISICGFLEKFLHIIVTIYTMAIVVNAVFIWEIYKVCSVSGWQGIFQTKYTLFVLAYFVLLLILKKVYFELYRYANK